MAGQYFATHVEGSRSVEEEMADKATPERVKAELIVHEFEGAFNRAVALSFANDRVKLREGIERELKRCVAKARSDAFQEAEQAAHLHNLLPHIAGGECRCDPSVGMAPCEGCAADAILAKFRRLAKEKG